MESKQIFHNQLKEDFIQILRNSGFTGSGKHFRKVNGEVVHAINFQNDKYGGRCCVNLGLHFSFLPVCWDSTKTIEPKKIKEVDCEFRARLAPKGKTDYWWRFDGGGPFGKTSKSIKHLSETYSEIGCHFFEKFNSLDSITSVLGISLLKHSDYIDIAGGIVPVRGALAMARIHKHLGNRELQHQYAKTGLQILGNASGLEKELEYLAQ